MGWLIAVVVEWAVVGEPERYMLVESERPKRVVGLPNIFIGVYSGYLINSLTPCLQISRATCIGLDQ